RDTWRDKGSGFLSYVLVSIPDFWFATLLILLFAAGLITQWFDVSYNIYASSFIEYLKTMTLPVLAYGYGAFAFLSRMMRNNMLETMEQDYIRTARAKGLNERQVVWRHALKNALMPFITLLGAALPALIGGSVVLERIFGISGLGSVVFNTTLNKDFPMILAVVVLSASLTLLGYLVSDLLYVWINPRVRLGKSHD
ncbi:MAG: ABC transporter permease, partial [Bacteroidota bacterium]